MALTIKKISYTISVNGAYGLPGEGASGNACAGTDNTRPPPCTRPRSFANYLASVSEERRASFEAVLNESIRALEEALSATNIPVEDQAYDIVQSVVVNVRGG
jgi:hypothetical protein